MEREADFLRSVHECVKGGGRVLIPCFALGRAQELCMLLEAYWERTQLSCPIYFSSSMTGKSTEYYKRFISWLNPALRDNFREGKRNPFDYKHITKFDKSYHEKPGPMVLFSTPGMLHSGNSLEVFKMWAPDPKNMLIIPGYCVPGTIGGQLMSGKREVTIDKRKLEVNLQVRTLSFSAHADAKGIKQLIANCRPRNVMLVHGEKPGMVELAGELTANGIPTYFPRNGDTVYITTPADVPVEMSPHFLKRALAIGGLRGTERAPGAEDGARRRKESPKAGCRSAVPFDGIVVVDESAGGDANPGKGGKGPHRLVDASEVPDLVDMPRQRFLVSSRLAFDPSTVAMVAAQCNLLPQVAAGEGPLDAADAALAVLFSALKSTLGAAGVRVFPGLAADSRRPDRLYVGEEAMEIYRLDALPPHEGDPRLFRELWLEDGWDAKFWEGEGAAARAAGVEELGVRWSEDSGTIAERAVRIAEDALRGDKLYPRVHPAGPLGARERGGRLARSPHLHERAGAPRRPSPPGRARALAGSGGGGAARRNAGRPIWNIRESPSRRSVALGSRDGAADPVLRRARGARAPPRARAGWGACALPLPRELFRGPRTLTSATPRAGWPGSARSRYKKKKKKK
ncbi:MAG: beta-lactamase-like protein, partial [Olpidium bornovanus]